MNEKTKSAVPYEQLRGDAGPQTNMGALASIEESRALKAAEARVILAKRFPRDEERARSKILKAFENPKLADAAMYSYPRGNETIEDLSIRAAETIANYWGNLEYGIQEIDRQHGYSEMLAYCWDLESNVYHYRAFKGRHWRDTRSGGYAVKDERDIYEVTFNLGARRLRSCILESIPAHIKEEAESIINETLRKAEGAVPIEKRVDEMLKTFGALNITRDMIERRLGHSLSAVSEVEMVGLRKIYKGIKDGHAKSEEFFEFGDPDAPTPRAKATTQPKEKTKPPAAAEKEKEPEGTARQETEGRPEPGDGDPEQDPAAAGDDSGDPMPQLTFTEAFTAIVKARTIEDLDLIRSQTKSLTEKQRENLSVSIINKAHSLSRGPDVGSGPSME